MEMIERIEDNQVNDLEVGPIVMKFGGTSVGNARAIEQVVKVIKGYDYQGLQLVVVVSAMSGVTNRLVAVCDGILAADTQKVEDNLVAVFDTHMKAVTQIRFSYARRSFLQRDLRNLYLEMRRLTQPANTPEDAFRARILGFGEKLSARIISSALLQADIPSAPVDATDGIITDDHLLEAKPDFNLTRERMHSKLQPLLSKRCVPVITGFIGSTPDGRPTVLGRGGSDYTASILGRVLRSPEVWIWTDVDGIYTVDPKTGSQASLIWEMSYQQADRMAKAGARVLYTKTVEPLMGTSTILRVKNTFNPVAPGTVIREAVL